MELPYRSVLMVVLTLCGACAMNPEPRDQNPNVKALADPRDQPVAGVDLGITDDETYKRPNSWALNEPAASTERLLLGGLTGPASRPGLSIAWRNAAQIEEVEVRVRNGGTEPGEGRVYVDVLDETGRVLLHLEPPSDQRIIRVPAFDRGGREGKILRMQASRELNNLIDRYDRERRRYDVRATVETIGSDANPYDNVKTKSWNIPFGVKPGQMAVYNYVFQNHEDQPVTVRWIFEHTPYPPGWRIEGAPEDPKPFVLEPGESLSGTLWMKAPSKIEEGAFVEARLGLVDIESNRPFLQHEWFHVYDSVPPDISNYRIVLTADHRVAITALVADRSSAVLEATGVTTEYSTDGGKTWSTRAHNYKAGNFVTPTRFEAVLGPFAPETDLQIRLTAKDTAGNVQAIIPQDAIALKAPPTAEKLIELAYVFPRTEPNPLFELGPGTVKLRSVAERSIERMTEVISPADKAALARNLSAEPLRVETVPLERVEAPGASLLQMTTLRLTVP